MKKKILFKAVGTLVGIAGLVTSLIGTAIFAADDISFEKSEKKEEIEEKE